MVKLSQIEYKKTTGFSPRRGTKVYTRGILRGFPPLRAGFEGAQSLANFYCFRVPGNDILALDEVQTVLYTHLVITRFLYRSAGLNKRQSLPKISNSSGFSSEMGVANLVVVTCPETLTHQLKKGVGLKQLAYCIL